MRRARTQDNWNTVYKRRYTGGFQNIDFNGLNNLQSLEVPNGILAICGLNGAGKSTIIAALKDIIGIPLSEYDVHKLGTAEVNATFLNNGSEVQCKNCEGQKLIDQGWPRERILYLDASQNAAVQDFLVSQSNLEELLDQYEEYELEQDEIDELNSIVGKRYRACGVRMIDDLDESGGIPYCKVSVADITYDSRGMGSGEHFLFYLFWCIKSIEKGSVLIIEEPETYISISSQLCFVDYLAEQIADKGITVILTTHSPYILKQIKNENIRIISRVGKDVNIMIPNENSSAERILGMKPTTKGTFFVEDRVAADFVSVLLEDSAPYLLREYTIDIVGGESEISDRLKFPKSDRIKYNFVGVYDGDMRNRLSKNSLNWGVCFLPGEKPLEVLFQDFLEQTEGIEKFSRYLQQNKDDVFAYVSTLAGMDYHDWFEELRKFLGIDGKTLVRAFYFIMKDDVIQISDFLSELTACLS